MSQKIVNAGDIINRDADLHKTAIIDLSKSYPRSFTFQQLDQLSNAVARGLLKKNIKAGEKIAILSDNSVEYISLFFGALRCGVIAVLVNTKLPEVQIKNILLETDSKLVFADRKIDTKLEVIDLNVEFDNFLDFGNFDIFQPNDNDTAFVLYTSGSFGPPKGAIITHRSYSWSMMRHLKLDTLYGPKRITLICAPLYHANGLSTIGGSIAIRSTTILLPKFNAFACIDAIEKYNINTFYAVPTMLSMIVQEKEYLKKTNLTSLRVIRMASSPLSEKLIQNIEKYFPNTIIFNSYGITEVGPGLFGLHPEGKIRPPRSVGYPDKDIEYRIVNGILEVKSPSMMTCYLNSEKNNSLTDDGFFITNDLFEVDQEGFYYFKGRADDMFKCGGNRVYPSQVESLLESHPAVSSAFVLSLEDDVKGRKPYAFVVLEKGETVSEDELKEFTLKNGPAYQHPRRIWFLDELPLAGTNKISKKQLESMAKTLANH